MAEVKSLTLHGTKYDSFVDLTARKLIGELETNLPDSDVTADRIRQAVADYLADNPVEIFGGLNSDTTALLIEILRHCLYETDQSANITALQEKLTSSDSGESEAVTYTVTCVLTNMTTDNFAVVVDANATYTAVLAAADGYVMERVSVTMGGVDVTDSVWSDGRITIAAVTGDVVITAVAVIAAADVTVAMSHLGDGMFGAAGVYADGGETILEGVSGAKRKWVSEEVFSRDTEVTIAINYGVTNSALKQWAGCVPADHLNNAYYVEEIGYAQPKEYTYEYVVRAGYRLIIINYNSGIPNAITVTKRGGV